MGSGIKEDLIEFACGLYAVPAVKKASLELQNSHGANVNVILWLCWLDARQVSVTAAALSNALDIVGGVNDELLSQLRGVRKRLDEASTFTKVQDRLICKNILAAELAIEKILLQRLQDLTARLDEPAAEAEPLSLFDYLNSLESNDSGSIAAELLEQSRNYVVIQRELA